ncbi:E3 ubiquitin-protein ligase MGRN1 isoform X6 [Pan troglodytes]|uniref:E3 ubiquitin-protein ligase MGRN1 isoform X6 n=2 Tax=Pan troglodytes TaxID=9598 RepID=UPI0030139A9B
MGSILSRRIAGVEDIDIQANSAYRYPPKSGNYFASHFFMGGEKFDTPHPEGYLFGENMDLNFLGSRPVQFPYVTPAPHEPVKTLRSLVNIRKDSLRLVRYKDDADSPTEDGDKPRVLYSLEFTFDADARVAITIYCQASEEFLNGRAVYSPKSPSLQSETVHYKRGVSQQFSLPSFKIDFSEWKDDELNFDLDRGVFPVVIQAVVDEGDVVEVTGHAHVLLAAFEKHMDGSFSVKPLKQKQIVDRVSYLLQEIYGIENKNNQETKISWKVSQARFIMASGPRTTGAAPRGRSGAPGRASPQPREPSDDENSDNSNECVVCLSDLRDTLILPCRHLCLCTSCADTLRYQANNCPICRLPFRALLQIRAVRKKPGALSPVSFSPVLAQSLEHDEHSCPFKKSKPHPASLASKKPKRETNSDSIPPGYEPISLLEALNGLRAVSPAIPSAPLYEEITYSGISDGLSQASCPLAAIDHILDSSRQKGRPQSKAPDSTLRSPSSPIHEEDEEKLSEDVDAPPPLGGAELALRESSSPESFITEEVDESSSPKQGTRAASIENVLQDSSPEHCGRGPPADIYLPALGPDSCSVGIDE